MSLITQVILRKGDRLYINDGIYGSFDELTLPGWNADYPVRVFTLDAKSRALAAARRDLPFRVYGPTCDTLDVLPRPLHAAGQYRAERFHRLRRDGRLFGGGAHNFQRLLSRHLGDHRQLNEDMR